MLWMALAASALLVASVAAGISGGMGAIAPLVASLFLLGAFALFQLSVIRRLSARNAALTEEVGLLEMAEDLGEAGRWQYGPDCDAHQWSPRLCSLMGIPPQQHPDPAMLDAVLGPGRGGLLGSLRRHAKDTKPFTLECDITRPDGEVRLLRLKARNKSGPDGEPGHVVMVARDVTDEYHQARRHREEQEMARAMACEETDLANIDQLTGLANRRHAMARIDRAVMAARKTGEPLSLVVFDLDRFKAVNEAIGRGAGDRMLVKIARITRLMLRPGDLAARIGGEEFVCLLHGVTAEGAGAFAEKLRWAIESGSAVDELPAVTASIGIADFEPSDSSLTLFARADAALYAAKQAGRNQVRRAA